MRLVKRVLVSVSSSLDLLLSRLQNHDALAAVSLHELDRKIREAQIAYGALTRSLEKVTGDIARAAEDEKSWTERARKEEEAGRRDAAIECLRRSHRAKATRESLHRQREQSEVSHRRLRDSIAELQNQQKNLRLKHRELKARSQVQDASASTSMISGTEVEDILNRWEDSLDIAPVPIETSDAFESQFEDSEQRASLEAELSRLVGKGS